MSDARWIEVEDEFSTSVEHFRNAVMIFQLGGFDAPGLDGYKSQMAFMHAMQSAHTSLESGLSRILDMLGEEPPTGHNWHEKLVSRVARQTDDRPAILSAPTARLVDETRRFRNIATRNYNNFRPSEAGNAVDAAEQLTRCLMRELATFKATIDPSEPGAKSKIKSEEDADPVP